jgi:hypothetical protein
VLYNLHASLTSIDRTDYSDSLFKGGVGGGWGRAWVPHPSLDAKGGGRTTSVSSRSKRFGFPTAKATGHPTTVVDATHVTLAIKQSVDESSRALANDAWIRNGIMVP